MGREEWHLPPSTILDSQVIDREELAVEHQGSQLSEYVHSAADLFIASKEPRGERSVTRRFVDFEGPEPKSKATQIEGYLLKNGYRDMKVNTSGVTHLFRDKMRRDLGLARRLDELR